MERIQNVTAGLLSWAKPHNSMSTEPVLMHIYMYMYTYTHTHILTVLCVVAAAAVAANVLDLFPDVTVDGKGHVVVVVRILAVPFLAAQRHDSDQAERLLLRFLHRHGRVFSAPRGKPSAVHDGGRRIHRRVIGRLEHCYYRGDGGGDGGGGEPRKTELSARR